MPDAILLDRLTNGSLFGQPQPGGLELDSLRTDSAALRPPLGDRRRTEGNLPAAAGRRKIWDFATNLHCSIIGTCLSTAELRQILSKVGRKDAPAASEHDLHASGVLIAGRRQDGAKLLHKALDRRHRVSINQFDKAKTAAEVHATWKEAVQRGDIPGAYWTALTHPATNDGLLREIFADVHMLSHLVGAANRADIRNLRQLEAEYAELAAKVERQQQQLRDAVVSRDATIRELRRTIEDQIALKRDGDGGRPSEPEPRTLVDLAADLKRRLATAECRCERLERRLEECGSALITERSARADAEKEGRELRQELEQLEASLAVIADGDGTSQELVRLPSLTLLYVGGRPAQIGHLRLFARHSGATFLHHDGGIEERSGLLQGLINRADAVVFPVDCISHAAMSLVKRTCLQSGKLFLPLRNAGLASFCAALNRCAALASSSVHQKDA